MHVEVRESPIFYPDLEGIRESPGSRCLPVIADTAPLQFANMIKRRATRRWDEWMRMDRTKLVKNVSYCRLESALNV